MTDSTQNPPELSPGPEPASPLPWERMPYSGSTDSWLRDAERKDIERLSPAAAGHVVAMRDDDAAAIVHRVNHYPAALARIAELEASRTGFIEAIAELEVAGIEAVGALMAARTENERMRETLQWFADEGHYEGSYRKGAGFASALGQQLAQATLDGYSLAQWDSGEYYRDKEGT